MRGFHKGGLAGAQRPGGFGRLPEDIPSEKRRNAA